MTSPAPLGSPSHPASASPHEQAARSLKAARLADAFRAKSGSISPSNLLLAVEQLPVDHAAWAQAVADAGVPPASDGSGPVSSATRLEVLRELEGDVVRQLRRDFDASRVAPVRRRRSSGRGINAAQWFAAQSFGGSR